MSLLLMDEHPLVILKPIAKAIGLNESIVLQQINYWIKINESKGINYYDGRYWVYNSIQNWAESEFDFWSYDTVKRTFKSLEVNGLLITGNYNREARDRTKWYTIDYEKLYSFDSLAQCIRSNCTNGLEQNAPMHQGNMPRALPETTTETNSETSSKHNSLGSKLPHNNASAEKASEGINPITAGAQFKKVGKGDYTEEFEEFWESYPRKIEKKAAFKAWKARIKSNKVEDIITACRNYAKYCSVKAIEEQYIKHASSFLGPNEPFKDFVESAHISSTKQVKGGSDTFSHYEQRQYDFKELEKTLLGYDGQS